MKITNVKIRFSADSTSKLKAISAITFDECFVVHDIKVVEGYKGMFIAMPSRKCPDGTFKDIAHPINVETRKEINEAVLAEYAKELKEHVATERRTVATDTSDNSVAEPSAENTSAAYDNEETSNENI